MTLILSGTAGLSDVDGSAATPAIRGTDANTGIFFPAADTVGIATNGTERMRLDSAGNMGLGVTPSAWGSSFRALQIGSLSGMSLMGYGGAAEFGNNFYFDTSYRYAASTFASRYTQSSGVHAWYSAASGTAGNPISFTQAMTLDASGNLGIGTTSPACRADVNGMIRAQGATISASGEGLELIYTNSTPYFGVTNTGIVQTYNRGSSTFTPIVVSGSQIAFGTGGSERARIDSSGNLLMGRTDNANSVSGCMYSVGTYNNTSGVSANVAINAFGLFVRATSSLKYKKNVQDATFGLEDVLKLRAVTYQGSSVTDTEQVYGGLIAEEVHEAGLTEFVQYAEDGTPDALAYGNMVSLCIKAIQEQQAIITQLQADVAALKGNA